MRIILSAAAVLMAAACNPPAQEPAQPAEAPAAEPAAPTIIVLSEQDARSRLEGAGYTNVTGLTQNADGTWSATGTRDGQTTTLTITDAGVQVTTTP